MQNRELFLQKLEKNGKFNSRFPMSKWGGFLAENRMANLKKSPNCVRKWQYSFSAIYMHNSDVVHVVFLV